jgi:hypothetical protein
MLLSLDRWKFLGAISVLDDLAVSSARGSVQSVARVDRQCQEVAPQVDYSNR